MKKQIFPIFDPVTKEFLFYKERSRVHTDGDWHKGIQANVIRKNGFSFDILVQKRSDKVDICKGKYDQSLAAQMIDSDNFNEDNALKRGLLEELGIKSYMPIKVGLNIRMIKTYEDEPYVSNKEILGFYIVVISPDTCVVPSSPKLENAEWMEWGRFLRFFKKNKKNFTKTAQFYFSTEEVIRKIEKICNLAIKTNKPDINLIDLESKELSDEIIVHVHRKNESPKTYISESLEILNHNPVFNSFQEMLR